MRLLSALVLCFLTTGLFARQPNVIFILADDLGHRELGCYGNDFNETPSLDKLSEQGMRFTDAYAAAPVCSPYRASLMTGLHPARLGIIDYLRPNSAFAISPAQYTLPRAFKDNGYTTGFIGKWHLTGYKFHDSEFEVRPTDVGFDTETGGEIKGVGNGANFWPYVFRDQPVRWLDFQENKLGEDEYLVDRMNHEAIQFIERNQKEPFFLYLSHYSTHSILNGRPDKVKKYIAKHPPGPSSRERCYLCQDSGHEGDSLHHWARHHNPHLAAMLESIDDGVGLIMEKLDELNLTDDTIVIFSSDNGGEINVTSNAPLRGGKSQLYEGGIRVPLIAHWPQKIEAGMETDIPVTSMDFYPTLLTFAGLLPRPKQHLDGVDVSELILGKATIDREALYWHYPHYHGAGCIPVGAMRYKNWKLVHWFGEQKYELYDLDSDLSELRDLSKRYPQEFLKLKKMFTEWQQSIPGIKYDNPNTLQKK